LLYWLQQHRRGVILVLSLLLIAMLTLAVVLALLPGGKTFLNAWYV
jgi:hypothetical protein